MSNSMAHSANRRMACRFTMTWAAFASSICLAGGTGALVGPDWEEGDKNDAGNTPATAIAITVLPGNPQVEIISGCLGCGGGDGDFEDLYALQITDPALFRVSTELQFGGSADFDTKLLLFDSAGRAIIGNDNASPGDTASTLTADPPETCPWRVDEPGIYFLGVTSSGRQAMVEGPDGPEFAFPPSRNSGIFCATVAGHLNPVSSWSGNGVQGFYSIRCEGVVGVSTCTTLCPADLNIDGVVDGDDLGALIAIWGTATCTDLAGGPIIDSADLGILLSSWGDC
ncbi:MAG: hypothetical protein MK085_07425 [Phycisphaerales bacterium]|nr:hypothetical protein [Phycisphaerales bacterium]